MLSLSKEVKKLSSLLNLIAGIFLIGMTGLTCADVILRIFRKPILGTYEIVEFLAVPVAGFALPYTTLKRGHVAVVVLLMRFSKRVRTIIFVIIQVLSSGLFALLSLECIQYGNELRSAGEVSLTLQLPLFPLLYILAFSTAVTCLVLLIDLWKVLRGEKSVE